MKLARTWRAFACSLSNIPDLPSAAAASCGAARGASRHALVLARRDEGQTMVEFAMVLPILLAILTGICSFGIALNQWMVLTDATNAGARAMALARGQTTPAIAGTDPCAYAVQTVEAAAPSLSPSSMTFTITYTTASTSAVTTYSNSCSGLSLNATDSVQMKVVYPVIPILYGWTKTTLNLTAQSTELVN